MPAPARLQGFDLSASMFPPPTFRASNITLTTHDCLTPFQAEHLGRYDVVHMRFLRCIITDKLAYPLLKNVTSLLSMVIFTHLLHVNISKSGIQSLGASSSGSTCSA